MQWFPQRVPVKKISRQKTEKVTINKRKFENKTKKTPRHIDIENKLMVTNSGREEGKDKKRAVD